MSIDGVPSLTAKSRKTKTERKKVLSDTYGIEIVLQIGDTMRSRGVVRKGDVLTQSECKNRPKSMRLEELVDNGFVTYVEERSHQHQVRHLDLTEDGWRLWTAVSEITARPIPEKRKERVWSDAEQCYIEVD